MADMRSEVWLRFDSGTMSAGQEPSDNKMGPVLMGVPKDSLKTLMVPSWEDVAKMSAIRG